MRKLFLFLLVPSAALAADEAPAVPNAAPPPPAVASAQSPAVPAASVPVKAQPVAVQPSPQVIAVATPAPLTPLQVVQLQTAVQPPQVIVLQLPAADPIPAPTAKVCPPGPLHRMVGNLGARMERARWTWVRIPPVQAQATATTAVQMTAPVTLASPQR